jgi:hypothetical protein
MDQEEYTTLMDVFQGIPDRAFAANRKPSAQVSGGRATCSPRYWGRQ